MSSIEVVTGQHIKIAYQSATVIHRIGASLADVVFQILYGIAVGAVFYELFDTDFTEATNNPVMVVFICLCLIPILFYHFLFEWLMGGQTPGKALLKIKVTNLDGTATGPGGYFLRWILRPVDMIFYGGVGILMILLTKNHQRLGDLAAGTVVIKIIPQQSEVDWEFYSFGANYLVKYPQAENLTPGQVDLIFNLLTIWKKNEEIPEDCLEKLAGKTKSVLNVFPGEDDLSFLKQVVKDYNYYSSLGF